MIGFRRNYLSYSPKLGLLRTIFQECPVEKEINLLIPIFSLAVLTASFIAMIALSIIVKYYPSAYSSIMGGSGEEMKSWIDENTLPKLLKFLCKFELEKRIGSKKNQTLLEAVDKNERKRFFKSIFYFFVTWIPSNFIILFCIGVKKSINNMMVKRLILIKCMKQTAMNLARVYEEMMSSMRSLL